MAMLYGGVYAKDLQHGFHPLGIDWLGSLCSIFDGGMISVLAMHVTERLKPRHRDEAAEMGLLTSVFLVFCLGAAGVVYGIKTTFNFYRADRMLGATWLLADILFGVAAWKLARRALARSVGEGEEGREPWVWALAAFGVWLPGARFSARVCDVIELPDVLLYFVVGVWTAAAVGLSWRLWRERGHFDHSEVVKSRPAAGAVLWRAMGALLIVAWLGADLNDARAGGVFSIAIDLPTRALFALAFLTAKLKV